MIEVHEMPLRQRIALTMATHRHYKGGLYKVIGRGIHTESKEELVLYRHLWPHEEGLWARPVEMFLETLPDGRRRFEPLREGVDP